MSCHIKYVPFVCELWLSTFYLTKGNRGFRLTCLEQKSESCDLLFLPPGIRMVVIKGGQGSTTIIRGFLSLKLYQSALMEN